MVASRPHAVHGKTDAVCRNVLRLRAPDLKGADHVLLARGGRVGVHRPVRAHLGALGLQPEHVHANDGVIANVSDAVVIGIELERVLRVGAVVGIIGYVEGRRATGQDAVARIAEPIFVEVGVVHLSFTAGGILWVAVVHVEDTVVVVVLVANVPCSVAVGVGQVFAGTVRTVVQCVIHVAGRRLTGQDRYRRVTVAVIVKIGVVHGLRLVGVPYQRAVVLDVADSVAVGIGVVVLNRDVHHVRILRSVVVGHRQADRVVTLGQHDLGRGANGRTTIFPLPVVSDDEAVRVRRTGAVELNRKRVKTYRGAGLRIRGRGVVGLRSTVRRVRPQPGGQIFCNAQVDLIELSAGFPVSDIDGVRPVDELVRSVGLGLVKEFVPVPGTVGNDAAVPLYPLAAVYPTVE